MEHAPNRALDTSPYPQAVLSKVFSNKLNSTNTYPVPQAKNPKVIPDQLVSISHSSSASLVGCTYKHKLSPFQIHCLTLAQPPASPPGIIATISCPISLFPALLPCGPFSTLQPERAPKSINQMMDNVISLLAIFQKLPIILKIKPNILIVADKSLHNLASAYVTNFSSYQIPLSSSLSSSYPGLPSHCKFPLSEMLTLSSPCTISSGEPSLATQTQAVPLLLSWKSFFITPIAVWNYFMYLQAIAIAICTFIRIEVPRHQV